MKLLLHCCCGPCATAVAGHFQRLGEEVVGWFFNPNIHPEEERRRREAALAKAAQAVALPLLPAGGGRWLEDFLLAVARRGGRRCVACYELRLEATARQAKREGFAAFSSTLLISPHQDLAAIERIGGEVGARWGVEFRFFDLRSRYAESCARARELGLYRQDYCGCCFSALERAERRVRRALPGAGERATGRQVRERRASPS